MYAALDYLSASSLDQKNKSDDKQNTSDDLYQSSVVHCDYLH